MLVNTLILIMRVVEYRVFAELLSNFTSFAKLRNCTFGVAKVSVINQTIILVGVQINHTKKYVVDLQIRCS